jgi:ABC-type histidine transport system ATPase subunit
MAKKVIATLKTGAGKTFTRCIKMVKSPKSSAYLFKEEMVHVDHIKDYFTEK